MKTFYGIGLMSGTSLDGLDICYAAFTEKNNWEYKILTAATLSYSDFWKEKLSGANSLSAEEILALNSEYGFYLGKEVQNFISENNIQKIDVIASHGHTIFHQPENKFTFQIGDGRAIKQITNFPVVYDFRMQDVLLGGNGAPLVPIGDRLLFSQYDACLNLGGFSNISFEKNSQRVAFDICPVNFVLNFLCEKIHLQFDKNGEIARNHSVDEVGLKKLNQLDFYQQIGPKSLGREWVEKNIYPILSSLNPKIAIATFTEHAAQQIAKTCTEHQIKSVLITGGGAYNSYLLERIKFHSKSEITLPEEQLIEFKEALIFAFMGVLRILNKNNVLASATGAAHNHCSGLLA